MTMTDGGKVSLHNPADMPEVTKIAEIQEPWIKATIMTPDEYLGPVLTLCIERRGEQLLRVLRRVCQGQRLRGVHLVRLSRGHVLAQIEHGRSRVPVGARLGHCSRRSYTGVVQLGSARRQIGHRFIEHHGAVWEDGGADERHQARTSVLELCERTGGRNVPCSAPFRSLLPVLLDRLTVEPYTGTGAY